MAVEGLEGCAGDVSELRFSTEDGGGVGGNLARLFKIAVSEDLRR